MGKTRLEQLKFRLAKKYKRFRELWRLSYIRRVVVCGLVLAVSIIGLFIVGDFDLYASNYALGPYLTAGTWLFLFGMFGSIGAGVWPYVRGASPTGLKSESGRNMPWWHLGALVSGVILMLFSAIAMVLVFAINETLSETALVLLLAVGLAVFFWGVILLFIGLKLPPLLRRFLTLLSPAFWFRFFTNPPVLTVRVRYDGRERIERLAHEFAAITIDANEPQEPLAKMLSKLRAQDYLIVQPHFKPKGFIQFAKSNYLRFELPLPKDKGFAAQKKACQKVLSKMNVLPGYERFGIQWNPEPYFEFAPWKNAHQQSFEILVINFRNRFDIAAQVGVGILMETKAWDGEEKLDFLLGTWDKSWWGKL